MDPDLRAYLDELKRDINARFVGLNDKVESLRRSIDGHNGDAGIRAGQRLQDARLRELEKDIDEIKQDRKKLIFMCVSALISGIVGLGFIAMKSGIGG